MYAKRASLVTLYAPFVSTATVYAGPGDQEFIHQKPFQCLDRHWLAPTFLKLGITLFDKSLDRSPPPSTTYNTSRYAHSFLTSPALLWPPLSHREGMNHHQTAVPKHLTINAAR
jgi:hypothetical protein